MQLASRRKVVRVYCRALPPIGFTAAKALVDAKAIDALRRVLRGPNPGGRGFAAVGLSTLGAVSQNDLQVIDMINRDHSGNQNRNACFTFRSPIPNVSKMVASFGERPLSLFACRQCVTSKHRSHSGRT